MFSKKTISIFTSLAFLALSTQAQIFTSTGGTQNVNAQSVGSPGVPNGQVRVKNAPAGNGNITTVRNNLTGGGVNSGIINNPRVMGNGGYASHMASLTAVKNTAAKLNQRPATAPTNGAIIINSVSSLNNNRNILKDNSNRTFVFRGNISVAYPILVGGNKTIWIDGIVNYNGVDVVPEGGAAFTPRPLKNDGVFSVRHEGSFRQTYPTTLPNQQANINFNMNLMNTVIKNNRKFNTTFRGTKRGKIIVQLSNISDDKQRIPKANGIVALSNNNLTIDGVTIEGALNAIYVSGSFNVNIRNCFTDKTVYRAIHLHGTQSNRSNSSFGVIKNNFLAFSKFDGIDLDSYSAGFLVEENWVVGARDRFLIWTEIDANNNLINNNVGVVLGDTDGTQGQFAGGFQENGTEASRRGVAGFQGTRNNSWTNNHSFYANRRFDGFEMRADRFIQYATITFTNNYVWTLNTNLHKHNPKSNTLNDIYYLVGTGGSGNNNGGNTGGNNGGNTGGNNGGNASTAPIGQTISFRKKGGDAQYVTAEGTGNNQLVARGGTSAPTEVWKTWERFVVESHPNGGVAIKALSTNNYIQVNGTDQNFPITARGAQKLAWEQFTWANGSGNNEFALQSGLTGKWINASWNQNNAILYPRGATFSTWETFVYINNPSAKFLNKNGEATIDIFPNPVNASSNINVSANIEGGSATINISDLNGRSVYSSTQNNLPNGPATLIIPANFNSGVYLVAVNNVITKLVVN